MIRRTSVWVLLVLSLAASAWGIDVVKPDSLSLKAGPTEPGEKLSLVWVESFVYPKQVGEDRIISLGVRTASKVRGVVASFDFSRKTQKLTSVDGMSWSTAYRIPESVADGVHVVRYYINGRGGSIQRTVEFFVETARAAKTAPDVARGETVQNSGWPLTVVSSCNAYTSNATRKLKSGQVLVSLARMQWYKVQFEDGQEGWVPGNFVKEPTEDYTRQGLEAYEAKNYAAAVRFFQNAVAVDPGYAKGYGWLAKSYQAQGELDKASDAIQQATRLDSRDLDNRVVAESLANLFSSAAAKNMASRRYHDAIAGYRKAVDLKADMLDAWKEMGYCYRRLGINSEARESWRQGLKADPNNRELRALLGDGIALPEKQAAAGKQRNVSSLVANDSLAIIKKERTSKGTRIEAAIKSVVALTKSLGTPIAEKGWQIKRNGNKFLVSYLCEQSGGALESFDWLVDVDTRHVTARNENARVLMSRW